MHRNRIRRSLKWESPSGLEPVWPDWDVKVVNCSSELLIRFKMTPTKSGHIMSESLLILSCYKKDSPNPPIESGHSVVSESLVYNLFMLLRYPPNLTTLLVKLLVGKSIWKHSGLERKKAHGLFHPFRKMYHDTLRVWTRILRLHYNTVFEVTRILRTRTYTALW